jgi:hypothetical protein
MTELLGTKHQSLSQRLSVSCGSASEAYGTLDETLARSV